MKKVFTKRVVLLVTALTLGCTFHYPVHAETTISQKENVTDISTNATNELSETTSTTKQESSTSSSETTISSTESSETSSSEASSSSTATSTTENPTDSIDKTAPVLTITPASFPVLSLEQRQDYGNFIGSNTVYRLNKTTNQMEEWPDAPALTLGVQKVQQKVTTKEQSFYGITIDKATVFLPEESLQLLGSYETINQYGSVLKKGQPLFTDAKMENSKGSSDALYQKTYRLTEKLTRTDGTSYYLLSDYQGKELGYINATALSDPTKTTSGGTWLKATGYASGLKATGKFYRNLELTNSHALGSYLGKTIKINGKYNHFNGKTYYSVYANNGNWLGYLEASSATLTQEQAGSYQKISQYVAITQNYYDIWQDFWHKKTTAKNLYQRTYLAKGKYEHFNGNTYYDLYDNQNKRIGLLNATGAKKCSASGIWQKEALYANRKASSYPLWGNLSNFSGQKGNSSKLTNKTVRITGKYRHFNGSLYYSLYDNRGNWLGYMNATGVKTTKNPQGTYFDFNKYITVTKSGYNTWASFSFNKKLSNSAVYQRTYKAKGVYYHYNGSRYYSLYDNKNNWKGYVNASSSSVANDAGGVWLKESMERKIAKNGYPIWGNTALTKQISTTNQHLGKIYKITGKYRHFNGSLYYSLYSNGKWVGYVNANATSSPHTIYSITSISKYVRVNNGSGNFFSQADPNSSKRGVKSPYKGYMARAAKQANTSGGTYYYLVMPGFDLGWVKASETSAVSEFWRHTTGGRYPSLNVPNLKIRVSVGKQRVTLLSGNKEIYTMLCSTGTYGNDTPYGNFAIQREKGLWFWSDSTGGAAYYRSFLGHGVYLFHSITITGPGAINSFSARQGEKLGTRASHGCIRLSVADAIWFYNNIPYGTPVSVVR